jgi:ParB family chromosome partitioning protein
MSKADTLGTSSAFNGAAGAMSARRAVTEMALGRPPVDIPVTQVPVGEVSLNPANPRSELGDLTDLAGSLKDHRQKTAISIMSRDAYLRANPEREDELEEGTRYVAVDGNSRLAAAREAGLETIKVMLDDDLGQSANELLESALVANVHRKDLDPLDEARALEQLLAIHGTQEALAARLHRSQGWVAQRLALLGLTPELKKRLQDGEEPVELLRRVGRKKPEQQEQHLQKLKEEKARKESAAKAARKRSASEPADGSSPDAGGTGQTRHHYGVMKPDAESAPTSRAGHNRAMTQQPVAPPSRTQADAPATPPALSAVAPPKPAAAVSPVPDQRTVPASKEPTRMPWADGAAAMDIIFENLLISERDRAIDRYLELLGEPEAFANQLRLVRDREFRRQLGELLLKDV